MQTVIYRNDSKEVYDLPDIGLVGPGQRVSHTGPFAPRVVMENYPGLVNVLEEEEAGKYHDYNKNPEPPFDEAAHLAQVEAERAGQNTQPLPIDQTQKENQNG